MDKLDDSAKIEAFLRGKGWPVTPLGPDTWRSSFRGSRGTLPLILRVEEGWVKLTVIPIARMPADPQRAEGLYQRLLRLNDEIMMARFSLDEDGDVLLSVEFPVADCDASEIQDSLDVLTFFAEKHQPEIKELVG